MNETKEQARERVRALARQFADRGNLPGWFDALYQQAAGDASKIPWADLKPNVHLTEWLDREKVTGNGRRALVIGCGLGDDAEALSRRGFAVTAFDLSAAAIEWAKRRFHDSAVQFVQGDVLAPDSRWAGSFDLIVEIFTLQVLKQEPKQQAMAQISTLLSPSGTLLVFCRGRNDDEPVGELPWPLSREELSGFARAGLIERSFEDYMDPDDPSVRRFRITYSR